MRIYPRLNEESPSVTGILPAFLNKGRTILKDSARITIGLLFPKQVSTRRSISVLKGKDRTRQTDFPGKGRGIRSYRFPNLIGVATWQKMLSAL